MKETNENAIISLEIEELEEKIAPTHFTDFTFTQTIQKSSPTL